MLKAIWNFFTPKFMNFRRGVELGEIDSLYVVSIGYRSHVSLKKSHKESYRLFKKLLKKSVPPSYINPNISRAVILKILNKWSKRLLIENKEQLAEYSNEELDGKFVLVFNLTVDERESIAENLRYCYVDFTNLTNKFETYYEIETTPSSLYEHNTNGNFHCGWCDNNTVTRKGYCYNCTDRLHITEEDTNDANKIYGKILEEIREAS